MAASYAYDAFAKSQKKAADAAKQTQQEHAKLLDAQENSVKIIKDSIAAQRQLSSKTTLTTREQQRLKISYYNLQSIYPDLISSTNDYKIAQNQLTTATNNLERQQVQLYNKRLQISRAQLNMDMIALSREDLPSSGLNRLGRSILNPFSPQTGRLNELERRINSKWNAARSSQQ